jgi:hypothetical protein
MYILCDNACLCNYVTNSHNLTRVLILGRHAGRDNSEKPSAQFLSIYKGVVSLGLWKVPTRSNRDALCLRQFVCAVMMSGYTKITKLIT